MSGEASENEEGAGSKMAQGACCSVCGCVLFPLALFMLGWNEKSYVCSQKNIIDAETNADWLDDCNTTQEGYVAFNCEVPITSFESFSAETFEGSSSAFAALRNIDFRGLAAQRRTEVYRCAEAEHVVTSSNKNKKSTTYTYSMQWTTDTSAKSFADPAQAMVSCTGFDAHDANKLSAALAVAGIVAGDSEVKYADQIKAGAFNMNQFKKSSQFAPQTAVPLGAFEGKVGSLYQISGNYAATNPLTALPCDPNGEEYGCVRRSYFHNDNRRVAAITESAATGVTSEHPTSSSWGCGAGTWSWIVSTDDKSLDKDSMLSTAHSQNTSKLWIMRIGGALLAWVAIYCVLYPIVAMADIFGDWLSCIPCCGDMLESIVEGTVTAVVCCMSCSFGCACALFVVAVVWIVMRPLIGLALMLVCCCFFGGAFFVLHSMQDPDKKSKRQVKLQDMDVDDLEE